LTLALLDLLPEALELADGKEIIFFLVVFGIFVSFLVEKILTWHHAHQEEQEVHPFTWLVVFGDTVHNFLDGIVIGASFLVSVPFGMITTLAVIFHEIPQEVGDFAILLHGGMKRTSVFYVNLFSSLSTVIGAVAAFFAVQKLVSSVPFILALGAGGFLYIATADLMPELAKEKKTTRIIAQVVLFLAGIGSILLGMKIGKV
jgi:zinc and cadmium transporter